MDKIPRNSKTSRKYPQNQDKPPPQKRKCLGYTHKTGRKCIFTQKKVTGMSPLPLLTDLGIVRWGLSVFLQHIKLGAQKGICRMLHQGI